MSQKPASLLVIAIIGIITSGFSLLLTPCGIFLFFKPFTSTPLTDALNKDPVYIAITITSFAVTLFLNLFLLTSSISAFRLARWARVGMIVYAWCAIGFTLLGTIPTFGYVIPKMNALAATMPGGSAAVIGGIAGGIFGTLIALALPIAILICFRRASVVNAFNGIFPASPANFPVIPTDPQFPA